MKTSTSLGVVDPNYEPDADDYIDAAASAVHALWAAHKQLCAVYQQRYHSGTIDPATGKLSIRARKLDFPTAWSQAVHEICCALLAHDADGERATALSEPLIGLLEWPMLQPSAATEGTL